MKERMEIYENMIESIAPSGKIAILDKKVDMTIIKHEDKPKPLNLIKV